MRLCRIVDFTPLPRPDLVDMSVVPGLLDDHVELITAAVRAEFGL